jgi:hypothetical protein
MENNAPEQEASGGGIVMSGGSAKSAGFDERVKTEASENANRHAAVQMVGVAMLDAHGNDIERYLCEKAEEDQGADLEVSGLAIVC